jgi:hypothetical protein
MKARARLFCATVRLASSKAFRIVGLITVALGIFCIVHVLSQVMSDVLAFYKIAHDVAHPDMKCRWNNFQFIARQDKHPLENML